MHTFKLSDAFSLLRSKLEHYNCKQHIYFVSFSTVFNCPCYIHFTRLLYRQSQLLFQTSILFYYDYFFRMNKALRELIVIIFRQRNLRSRKHND